MYVLLMLLIPPLAGLLLIILAAIWATNVLTERFVGRKHRLLEEMMTTGEMPQVWSSAPQVQQHDAKARKKLLRKLDRLIKYAQTTPLVADEESRQVLLDSLDEIRVDWSNQGRDE